MEMQSLDFSSCKGRVSITHQFGHYSINISGEKADKCYVVYDDEFEGTGGRYECYIAKSTGKVDFIDGSTYHSNFPIHIETDCKIVKSFNLITGGTKEYIHIGNKLIANPLPTMNYLFIFIILTILLLSLTFWFFRSRSNKKR